MSHPASSPRRPRVYGVPATATIHVRVSAPVRLELRRMADAGGVCMSDVVRQLIDDRVDDSRGRTRRRGLL